MDLANKKIKFLVDVYGDDMATSNSIISLVKDEIFTTNEGGDIEYDGDIQLYDFTLFRLINEGKAIIID